MSTARSLSASILLVVMVAAASCSDEADEIDEIGTMRLRALDPALNVQKFKHPETTIQVAEWQIHNATFTYLGEAPIDLLAGTECLIVDFPLLPGVQQGNCTGGLIIGTDQTSRTSIGMLEVDFTMRLRRAWSDATVLDPGDDFDGDGELNADDICPLVHADKGTRARPIPCILGHPHFTSSFVDSDGDGLSDPQDNCIWVPNNDALDPQLNTRGIGPGDLIGDACDEQTGEVTNVGHLSRLIYAPAQKFRATTITLDFHNERTLTCDWEIGRCELDIEAVRVCASVDSFANFLGCVGTNVQVVEP